MELREMLRCAAQPVHPKKYGPNLVFGLPYIRPDGTAVLIGDTINGETHTHEVRPETISRPTGIRRKDGFVYEHDSYTNPKGDTVTVFWSDDHACWKYGYDGTSVTGMLCDMPDDFEKVSR